MSQPVNHYKLGLFVLLGLASALGVVVFLGARSLQKNTVTYHTYFNESVQGLDVGAPVKYRGVTIGNVSGIEVAPDHRHVDVISKLDVEDLKRMSLAEGGGALKQPRLMLPPDLRAQLGSQGITGVKYVSIDFFDPKANPPPDLPFKVDGHYIPAAPSMMKNLEDTIAKAMDRLPDLVDAVVAITGRIDRMVAQLEKDDVTGKAVATLAHADDVVTGLKETVTNLNSAQIPAKAASTIADIQVALAKMNKVLDHVDGDKGVLASVQRGFDAFGDVGRSATGTTRDLDITLREVREAAESIRILADALDRDPDMLIKGRSSKAKSK